MVESPGEGESGSPLSIITAKEKAADSAGTGQKETTWEASPFTPTGLSSFLCVQEGTPSILELHWKNTTRQAAATEPVPRHRAGRARALGTRSKAGMWAADMMAAGWYDLKGSGSPRNIETLSPWGDCAGRV